MSPSEESHESQSQDPSHDSDPDASSIFVDDDLLDVLPYEPLPTSKSIRLLKIPEDSDEDLYAPYELEVYDLDRAPPFNAISYTWGAPIKVLHPSEWFGRDPEADYDNPRLYDGHIQCNELLVRIGENLFDCLDRVSKARPGEYVWIDALCINQHDIAERNSQVRLMSDIYASAARTIVWLGRDSIDAEGVKMVLDHFLPSYQAWYNSLDQQMQSFTNRIQLADPWLLQQLNLSGSPMDWVRHWRALQRFFWRTKWFHRAWIIQEVSLASSIQVLYGEETLDWDALVEIVNLIHTSDLSMPVMTGGLPDAIEPPRPPLEGAKTMTSLFYMHTEGLRNPTQLQMELGEIFGSLSENERWYASLTMTLQQARTQECADPRDKVYANWSLVKHFAPPGLEDAITPNYDLPVDQVYVTVAETICSNLPRMSMLSYVLSDNEDSDLPTWVPDFRTRPLGRILITHYPHFNAAPPNAPVTEVVVQGDKISILAYHIDTIDSISPTLSDMNEASDLTPCLEICLELESVYAQTGEHRLDALWRTLICDTSAIEHPAPLGASRQRFRGWLLWQTMNYISKSFVQNDQINQSELTRIREIFERVQSVDWPLPDETEISNLALYHKYGDEDATTDKVKEQYHRLHNIYADFRKLSSWALNGRRIFKTSKSHIGLGLEPTKPGDQIWLLGDAKVPFILRSVGSDFGLVGDAYLHGFMYGTKLDSDVVTRFRSITIV